ncbi:hypothetical protein EDD52_1103 [Primorskyibacter sedentarius]|jgi:hypothetical protein|uniref:YCII-related domain-containing protein n=1 Tax=Primorskyibacter sedentarius TaxID=745311 RepID=A0A4R3JAY9_9RHOB|nr:hypothetical protein [Primorskyibacter sedentarius]TCS61830.1 hypothetical protein EDD52_1103 [Primorskyibacter sedentarius]
MALLVSVTRVSHIPVGPELEEFHAAHKELFGDAAGKLIFLRDPNDANQAAVVGEVHDLEKMRAISRTPEGDAMMRKFGFVEQLSYFLEDD